MFNPAMFESMKHMMNGPMMKQSAEMMSKMSDEELKQYMSMAGMNVDPSFIRNASQRIGSMDDATLDQMKETASKRFSTPVSPPPPSSPSSSSELSSPLNLKNQGNDFFKQGKTTEAAEKYLEGIKEIEKIPISSAASELEVTLRLNLCACWIKESKHDEVIAQCKKVLILGENPKAYYRYGQALFYLANYEQAKEYLEKARKSLPQENNIINLLNEINEKIASNKIQDKPKDRGIDLEISPNENSLVKEEKKEEKKIEVSSSEEKVQNNAEKKIKDEVPVVKKDKIVEKIPKEEPKQTIPKVPENINLPNLSQNQMTKGLESLKNMDPNTISQMANTLKHMDPRLMQNIFKSQGIEMPPEEIAKMADMLTPENINMITSSLGKGPSAQSNPNLTSGPSQPMPTPDITSMLSNPELTRMASEMLGKQLGKKPEDIQVLLSCFGKLMKFFMKIAKIYQFFMAGNRKYFTISIGILGIAHYFGMLSN